MKKYTLLLLVLTLMSILAKAQPGNRMSAAFCIDEPFNTGAQGYNPPGALYQDGLGASFRMEVPVTLRLHFRASGGLAYYHSNVEPENIPLYLNAQPLAESRLYASYKMAPLKAGLQYYIIKYLYVSANAGYTVAINSPVTSTFIYSGGLGSALALDRHSGFDLSVDYGTGFKMEGANYYVNEVGLRIAYKFTF
jgi:hypothetical protein